MSETVSGAQGATGAWSYRAGGWFAVFGSKVTLLLPESERDRVVALWALVDGGAGFDEVLDGLLAAGLSTLPGFVLVSTDEGPTRVLLRGQGVTASLSAASEQVELDGAAGHTWVERTVDDVTGLRINLPEPGEEGAIVGDVVDLPILTGLVRVSRVSRVDRPAMVAGAAGEGAAKGAAAVAPVAPVVPAGEPSDPIAADPVMLEPEPELSPLVEPSPLDHEADTAATPGTVAGDPLTDPLPPEPPAEDPADETEVDPDAHTELLPQAPAAPSAPGWISPPPPPPVPPVPGPVDAPPLTVGSWQPLGGSLPPPPPPPPPPAPSELSEQSSDEPADIDHDGLTVAGGGRPPPPPAPGIPGQPPAPAITRPVAKLVVSDGQTVLVDRAVLVGRAPEARRFNAREQPVLITVPSRLHEISSTHIEVRPGTGADHGSAVVTDMGSTNGTVLVQPGLGPEDLKPGIAVQLIPGAVINLGDGITIQVTRP